MQPTDRSTEPFLRTDIRIPTPRGSIAAWVYQPADATVGSAATTVAGRPAIVMAHGLSGTRRDRLGAFASRFAEAGYAAVVFDHIGFGESEGRPDVFDPKRQQQDWADVVAHVRAISWVDAERLVTFGSSMGGGNALAAAAADPGIVAAVSQVPFLDLHSQAHRSSLGVRVRMLTTAMRNGYLPAVGQPHEVAFINAPGAEAGWRGVVEAGEESRWRNRVSARWLITAPVRAGRHASSLHCPWLVCVGDADQVAAPGPAIRAARRAPHGELRIYPGVDHFDIYDGAAFELLVADQLEFLGRHVPAVAPTQRERS